MLADVADLVALAGKGGDLFEQFLYSLIVEEGRKHGLAPSDIDWDYRTAHPDGGRDIVIKRDHTDPSPRFIPQKRSIWSAKSGEGGVEPSKLREEIRAAEHPAVREHLRAGNPYIWCALHPIDQDGRKKMETAAAKLGSELGFDPKLIQFRWCDALCATLNDHPNAIAKHLPDVASRMKGVRTLRQWEREDPFGFSVEWVDFADRDKLRDQLRQHLLGRGGPNVLHLAGLSGTGKTRTVLEACRSEAALHGILYVAPFNALSEELYRYLEAPGRQACVVVDEMPLQKREAFVDRVGEYADRLRFVTIGPSRRDERERLDLKLYVLSEPALQAGVLEIVRRAGAGLPDPVLASIATCSAHDLRLAILLARATRQNAQYRENPVRNSDDVWERVTWLFRDHLGDTNAFRRLYEVLTTSIDVGCRDPHRAELDYVAGHFGVAAAHLEQAATLADKCGLGVLSPASFFEAQPRALALWLFQDRVWSQLRLRLMDFLRGMPSDRLRRRFLERCQECSGPLREVVEAALALFFATELGDSDLGHLVDRQRSRVFQAWAELDPLRGLSWLKEAVRRATPDQLRELDGRPDGSGGWRGRRQLVGLCEHLSCFAEHFWNCEEILFQLARVETEASIGNNSTHTWQVMFRPVLANTEVPFPDRLELLLRRLRDATTDTLPLILSAALGIMDTFSPRMAPPAVVGGRVVPQQWQPRSVVEWRSLITDAQRRVLAAIVRLEPSLRKVALGAVVHDLGALLRLGILQEVREATAIEATDEEFRRELRAHLNQVIALYTKEGTADTHPPPGDWLESVRRWSEELAPRDLTSRIKELTANDYWAFLRTESL